MATVQFSIPLRRSSNGSDDMKKSSREDSFISPYLARRPSQAAQLVDCFQELNERLSAFERLAQLKQMVMDGKLKQDVFEEMYRINTEKLVDGKRPRRRSKKFDSSSISVLDDFCVKHRSTVHGSPTFWDLTAAFNAKLKRGCLYFDRIVLKSAATFGTHQETIIIGTQPMTLVMYDDAPERVDLAFEKRQEQFVFDSELEKLMFVEALEKALETVARSSLSRDEPVLLGRPHRSHSQISKDFDARKSACLNLEKMSSSNPSSAVSERSLVSTASTNFSSMATDDDEDANESDEQAEEETEEKEDEDENVKPGSQPMSTKEVKTSFEAQKAMTGTQTEERPKEEDVLETLTSDSFVAEATAAKDEILGLDEYYAEIVATSVVETVEEPDAHDLERAHLAMQLHAAREERVEALAVLEQKKLNASKAHETEKTEQEILNVLKADEDKAIKYAFEVRDEDVKAAKTLAECVAAEIAALNALDPEDIASTATSATYKTEIDEQYPMSNDLRALVGKKPQQEPISLHHKLRFSLQQARKALAAARQKVEKTSEKRRLAEAARRESRKLVSAQMSKCTAATRQVTHCEGSVLKAKAALSIIDDRISHYEQCLLILIRHHERKWPAVTVAKPATVEKSNESDWDQLIT
jgi:hypothetical protein